jgi:hypothetical protein
VKALDFSGKTDLAFLGDFCSIIAILCCGPVSAGIVGTLHGGSSMSISEVSSYRSPISKLLPFFCGSRDKWKAKCKAAKRENKSLKYCLAKMKESRDRWKSLARDAMKNAAVEIAAVAEETTKNRVGGRAPGRPPAPRRRPARLDVAAAK